MRKSKFCANKSNVYVSDNMTAKLFGVPCIGTSLLNNRYCMAHRESNNPNLICSSCFAVGTLDHYKSVHPALSENEFLKDHILEDHEIPIFKAYAPIVRFEHFGDIETPIQVLNYFKIAKANKNTKFALWTKNAFILYKAFHMYDLKKLSNMTLVFSAPVINVEPIKPPMFDKVFTVYDQEHAKNVNINCGAKSCLSCQRCYTRKTDTYVREILK